MATILVIDDEDVDRMLVAEILRAEGHEVLEAVDGDEGSASANRTAPHLLITDIMMPGKDGLEVIKEIKKNYPGMKIIAVSGGGKYNQIWQH